MIEEREVQGCWCDGSKSAQPRFVAQKKIKEKRASILTGKAGIICFLCQGVYLDHASRALDQVAGAIVVVVFKHFKH